MKKNEEKNEQNFEEKNKETKENLEHINLNKIKEKMTKISDKLSKEFQQVKEEIATDTLFIFSAILFILFFPSLNELDMSNILVFVIILMILFALWSITIRVRMKHYKNIKEYKRLLRQFLYYSPSIKERVRSISVVLEEPKYEKLNKQLKIDLKDKWNHKFMKQNKIIIITQSGRKIKTDSFIGIGDFLTARGDVWVRYKYVPDNLYGVNRYQDISLEIYNQNK